MSCADQLTSAGKNEEEIWEGFPGNMTLPETLEGSLTTWEGGEGRAFLDRGIAHGHL